MGHPRFRRAACPSRVPCSVLEIVKSKLPGGRITDCEKEYERGELYWEVTMEVHGSKKEIMVSPPLSLPLEGAMVTRSSSPFSSRWGRSKAGLEIGLGSEA